MTDEKGGGTMPGEEEWQVIGREPRHAPRPRIYASLNKRGEIAMNAYAFKQIGQPANVALLWDAARRRIGVKFPVSADRYFVPARRYGRGGRMRVVRAGSLLKEIGVTVERTMVFRDARIETLRGHPMLVLELDEGAKP